MPTFPESLEGLDPGRRFYKRQLLRAKAVGLILVIVVAAIALVGFPAVQGDYTFHGTRSPGGWVPADQKISAWYLGVTGWRQVYAIERHDHRLPAILLVPIGEVFRLDTSFPFVHLREQPACPANR